MFSVKKSKRLGGKTSPKREEEIDIECIIFANESMQAIVERNVHVKFEGNRYKIAISRSLDCGCKTLQNCENPLKNVF